MQLRGAPISHRADASGYATLSAALWRGLCPTISMAEAWIGALIFSASCCMRDAKTEHDVESFGALDFLRKIKHGILCFTLSSSF